MSDVDQLLEVMRQIKRIQDNVAEMQLIPIDERDDLFYRVVEVLGKRFDELEADRVRLLERIPNGEKFYIWLLSNFTS